MSVPAPTKDESPSSERLRDLDDPDMSNADLDDPESMNDEPLAIVEPAKTATATMGDDGVVTITAITSMGDNGVLAVLSSTNAEVRFISNWWGFELHCNQRAVDLIETLRGLILDIVSFFLPNSLSALISVYSALRGLLMRRIANGNGARLLSPWPSPLMLSPRRLQATAPPRDTSLRWSVSDDITGRGWTSATLFPDHHSWSAAGMAEHNSQLHCVHRGGANDENLWWTFYGADTGWSADERIQGQFSFGAPALIVYRNRLHCVYRGRTNDERLYMMTLGVRWSASSALPHGMTSSGYPALEVINDRIILVFRGPGRDEHLMYSTFDGTSWSLPIRFPHGMSTAHSPALKFFAGRVFCVYRASGNDNRLLWTVSNGHNWIHDQQIRDLRSDNRPGLAVLNNRLYLGYRRIQSTQVWTNSFTDQTGWTAGIRMADAETGREPTLVSYSASNAAQDVQGTRPPRQIMAVFTGV